MTENFEIIAIQWVCACIDIRREYSILYKILNLFEKSAYVNNVNKIVEIVRVMVEPDELLPDKVLSNDRKHWLNDFLLFYLNWEIWCLRDIYFAHIANFQILSDGWCLIDDWLLAR